MGAPDSVNEAEFEARIRAAIFAAFSYLDQSDVRHQLLFSLKLGHTAIQLNGKDRYQVGGRADVLITKANHPLVMLELKRPGIALTDDDRDQGLSYARLTTPMPPLVVVSNGSETKCYLTQTGEAWDPSSSTEADLLQKLQQATKVAAEDLDRAVEILMGVDTDWVPAINAASLTVIDERSGAWDEPLRPFVRGFRILRRASTEAMHHLRQNKHVLVVGPPLAGKSSVLCQLVEGFGTVPKHAALLIESGSEGIFEALANLLSERLGWHVTAGMARDWLRKISNQGNACLLLAIDGFQQDHAQTLADLNELSSARYGDNLSVVVSSDDAESQPRLKSTGRELTPFGRRCTPVEVGSLDDDEFKAAAKALEAHGISLTPGSKHDEGLREPWVLRALVPTDALSDPDRPAKSYVRLPPMLDLASLGEARKVMADDAVGRAAMDRLADALLKYYLERRPAKTVLASVGRLRVPQDYLATLVDASVIEALTKRGVIRSGLDEDHKAVWWVRLPILTAALVATSLSRAHDLWAENGLSRIKVLASRLPLGSLIVAEALRLRIVRGDPGSRTQIESLLADEPTAEAIEVGAELLTEMNGVVLRIKKLSKDELSISAEGRPAVSMKIDPDEEMPVISCTSWLILSHLSALPLALTDAKSGEVWPIGQAIIEQLGPFPHAIPSGSFSGSPTQLTAHGLPGGGSVVCHQEGIVEPITWAIQNFLRYSTTDANDWIDHVASGGNLPLQTRVAAALTQLAQVSGEVGKWARGMLDAKILPNLRNHIIADGAPD